MLGLRRLKGYEKHLFSRDSVGDPRDGQTGHEE